MSANLSEAQISAGGGTSTNVAAGDVLGRYQLLARLSAGGMGAIWIAQQIGHPQLRKIVAVKVAHEHLSGDPEFCKMFLDEARLASAVQHSNVCAVLDLGEERGLLYLVMEWIGGGSLKDVLDAAPESRLPPRVAARIIADAAAGLHAAHELRDDAGLCLDLVHRDVSPDNILLTPDGHVKVADFGIARARNQLHKQTETGDMKGKLAYMAPEVFGSREYDRRIDVYSLGCVLYRAAIGCKPFRGNDVTLIYEVIEGRFSRPREVDEDFPAELEEIIERAMSPVDARFPTADAMRRALEDWIARSGEPCTSVEVSAHVQATIGPKIIERSQRVKNAMTRIETGTFVLRDRMVGQGGDKARPEEPQKTSTVTGAPSELTKAPATRRRLRGVVATVSGAAIVVASGIVLMLRSTSHGSTPPAPVVASPDPPQVGSFATSSSSVPAATPSDAPPASPATIVVSVRATPTAAVASIDDGTPLSLPYRGVFPRDGRLHTVHVEARGYRPEDRKVMFADSIDLVVSLVPRAAGEPRPSPSGTEPPTPPTVTLPATAAPAASSVPPTGRHRKPIDSTDPFKD